MVRNLILAVGLLMAMMMISACTDDDAAVVEPIQGPAHMVVSHDRRNITTIDNGQTTVLTDSGDRDWKPVTSLDGEHIVFFRVDTYAALFMDWRTRVCVMNYDGTGFRELTSGDHGDFNPTFLRDGTNRIIFNRLKADLTNEIYMTTMDASPGDEVMISHPTEPKYEWVYSSLADGRLLVHYFNWGEPQNVYLLTPNPGGVGTYELVTMPSLQLFHKACISPDETKIVYLYDHDGNGFTYSDSQLAWAKFDADNLRVYDEVLVGDQDLESEDRYPKWNEDGTLILYTSNKENIEIDGRRIGQIYAYRLEDGADENITPENDKNYQDLCVRGLPK